MLKINPKINNAPTFKGALNNKNLLKGLGFVSEHSASTIAGVSFLSAVALRPYVISKIPNANQENKKYLSASSISSGLTKLLIAETIALPIENAIKKIDKNPKDYLKKDTIENFCNNIDNPILSKDYKFLTQTIKQGSNFLSAIPKSFLTVALLPVIADKILKVKNQKTKENTFAQNKEQNKKNNVNFKGKIQEFVTKNIADIINNEKMQKFAQKNSPKSADISRNMAILTDTALAFLYSIRTKKSKKIEENKKNVLIKNELISTSACILAGSAIDKFIKELGSGFVEKFTQANKNDPKLLKYLEGLNVLRPTIIFALVYYGALPFISGYFANKTQENNIKN